MLFFKGLAMGAADVIPGVSGGTIAFITGIYHELIDSLGRCDHRAFMCLIKRGPVAAWQHINGTFLLVLFSGILVSIFSLAKLVTYCLEAQPILVWSFFFGLIVAASLHLLRQVNGWDFTKVFSLIIGVALALAISTLKPTELPDTWWVVMAAGSIAICAMILPGISGGFLLLMMGMYSTIVEAVSQFDLALLLPFGLGCGLGLMLFSHVLAWLLARYYQVTLALLTGILIGSLNIIWPWKQTLATVINRHGETVPLVQENVLPAQFTKLTAVPHQFLLALLLCALGVILVLLLERVGTRGVKADS